MSFLFDRSGLLRPPGAADEADLVGSCIRCARCVEVRPYQSIRLGPITALRSYGTPFIDPLGSPCYLCMRCPEVCPTSALTVVPAVESAMGTARVIEESCYSWTGTVCNQCYRSCPLKGTAIDLDDLLQPVVTEACVGCGVCLHVCPTEPRSIHLVPRGETS
ncbi:MAG: 4Fe-4S dicluster domain-containing protein [Deltaproteobacteria bacterium]|nr:MAG: 4Fe-4S dicluster domain-containing protein [Deltaproteobacteria bacterium]